MREGGIGGWISTSDAVDVALELIDEVRREERARWMAYVEEQLAKLRSALT